MVVRIVFLIISFIASFTLVANADVKIQSDDMLAGIKLGSRATELLSNYPNLYKHDLIMGETLYEACNQNDLEVFTFAEAAWSKGYITYISINYADVSVCRDETGSLPDLSISPISPRGVRLGDSIENVLEKYGEPSSRDVISRNNEILFKYKFSNQEKKYEVVNMLLVFSIKNNRVVSISLAGDMPGYLRKKKEFEKRFR